MLSPALLQELKIIIKEEFNQELSDQEITEVGTTWVNFFRTLIKQDNRTGKLVNQKYENKTQINQNRPRVSPDGKDLRCCPVNEPERGI